MIGSHSLLRDSASTVCLPLLYSTVYVTIRDVVRSVHDQLLMHQRNTKQHRLEMSHDYAKP